MLSTTVRWVAPSAVAACAGALVAGLLEGTGAPGAWGLAATSGFFALLAVPVLLGGAVLARALWAAWRPRELGLVEDDGSAPRLAGWLAVIWLGAAAVALVLHEATWLLAERTAFRPPGVALAQPVIAVAAVALVAALSRPGARLFAHLARRLDARWRRRGRATLLRPRAVIAVAIGSAVLAAWGAWRLVVKPKLGPLDTGVLHGPALAVLASLAVHVAWARLPRRAALGAVTVALGVAAIGFAFATRYARPSLTLEIWGDRPVAGLAIDQVFDLEAIRAGISLAEFRPAAVPGEAHPDLVLVTIDTLRADRTPPYGGPAEMPMLRELAKRGTTFTWAFAPSNVTRRSVPAIVLGLEPNRIRGRVVGWALRLDPRHVLLAERLRAGGYETAGFVCCDGFWGDKIRTGWQRGLEHLVIEPDGAQLASRAAAWLAARERRPDRRPLFLWMHVLEPHNWTAGVPAPRDDEARKRYYDRSLAASDAMLGQLLQPLARRAPDQLPIVIVTADHGEALGDHGHDYHSTDLYNSQMRVPLVIAGPGIRAQAVPETVGLVDLVPTILDLAGFEPPALDGASLAPVLRGRRASRPDTGTAFAAMIRDRSNPGGITAFVRGRWKIIANDDGSTELYDLYEDPDELVDLARRRPALVRELEALLAARLAAGDDSPFD